MKTVTFEFSEGDTLTVILAPSGQADISHTFYPSDEDEENHDDFQTALDGVTSLILAQACAGVDITTPEYADALQTAIQAIANRHF